MDLILFLTGAIHLIYTPFTKVEESFNLQAMHDILYLRHNFSKYDHHEFPGVVPRTFVGPLFVSIISSPFVLLFESLAVNKFWAQYVVRLMLGVIVANSWSNLKKVITKFFDVNVSFWFTLITVTQFHFMFYMTRPLPNVMALPVVLYAITYWMKGQTTSFIVSSGIAILVFRSELIIFLGLLLANDLIDGKISLKKFFKVTIPAGFCILLSTIIVDSLFWKRLLWPEGEVLWYNTVLNKSSDWGTSPFFWYFYSALPRALGASILFLPIGLYYERRIRSLVASALLFVLIYSLLPHKELRFIIYIFPVLNISVACACHRLWINRTKSLWHGFLALCTGAHLIFNIFLTLFLLIVSGTNYPGGVALTHLNHLEANNSNVRVHIANLAAQSGVSRFLQIHNTWHYSKNESMKYLQEETVQYTHLLVESKNKLNNILWNNLQEEFETIDFIDCFNSIGIQYNSIIPMRIKTKPCLAILKKRKHINQLENIDVRKATDEDLKNEDSKDKTKRKRKNKEVELKEPEAKDTSKKKKSKKDKNKENNLHKVEEHENAKLLSTLDAEVHKIKELIDPKVVDLKTNETFEDGVVENVEDLPFDEDIDNLEHQTSSKDINYQELRNLALGQVTRKTKATKLKIRKIIEDFYRSKGKQIETDSIVEKRAEKRSAPSTKQSVKAIIKQEKIKQMIEQISTMDLTRICDLEKTSTKDCLKQVIDKIDSEENLKI